MHENHYYGDVLRFVTDLTNRPPTEQRELTELWRAAGLGAEAGTAQDLVEIREFLARWTEVVDADTEATRVRLLNALLAETAAYPRITDHAGTGWHLHYRDDDVPLAAMIRTVTVVAAAKHLTRFGMHRLGRCALRECRRAFVDMSRGGRQRYCTRTCANRDAVRRHRAGTGWEEAARSNRPML
ncbi:CGNR zinc finger domain-containing protein [Nocardia mexicana]|uniref:CGNR zinc finger protein n=1 Tax=Nocardia mexicana TaxID=279262 RepID=A0A370HBN6_9NOCA|nr:CGNR zinc finger domain-containing protein [Nocardia mexicana]RDI54117.1 CGNR zinc finger protein [Nocardia mexicana]